MSFPTIPGLDIPRTPTLRDYYKGPEPPCGLRDFRNARSVYINWAQIKVNQNHHKLQRVS